MLKVGSFLEYSVYEQMDGRIEWETSTHVSVFCHWEFTDLLIEGFLPLGLPTLTTCLAGVMELFVTYLPM